jgi:hypothetical protein
MTSGLQPTTQQVKCAFKKLDDSKSHMMPSFFGPKHFE